MKSGLQREVLSLYRELLKTSKKQICPVQIPLNSIIRQEFKIKSREIDKKDLTTIEYQLRIGRKRLEFFKEHSSIKKITFKFI